MFKKHWKWFLIFLLLASNIVTLFFYIPLVKEKHYINKNGEFFTQMLEGDNGHWKITNASRMLYPTVAMNELGRLTYTGEKDLTVTYLNVQAFSVTKDGKEDSLIGFASDFGDKTPETISNGYVVPLGAGYEGIDVDSFKERLPVFKHDRVKVKITYKIAKEKKKRHESFFLSTT